MVTASGLATLTPSTNTVGVPLMPSVVAASRTSCSMVAHDARAAGTCNPAMKGSMSRPAICPMSSSRSGVKLPTFSPSRFE
jgi:hypothetical protein